MKKLERDVKLNPKKNIFIYLNVIIGMNFIFVDFIDV